MKEPYAHNPAHLIGTCAKCGEEMIFNVPRLGANGGYVHKSNGKFDCNNSMTPQPTEPIEKVIAREILARTEKQDGFPLMSSELESIISKHLQPERNKFNQLLKIAKEQHLIVKTCMVITEGCECRNCRSVRDFSHFLTTLSPQNEGKKE